MLITAGPTQEPLDPVRYISNRSSGKMGYALAEAAAARGAHVMLVSGPVHLAPPRGCDSDPRAHRARDARPGIRASASLPRSSSKPPPWPISICRKVPAQKIKKTAARLSLELDPTPDILAELGRKKGDRLLIGFAAETENLRAGNPPQAGSQELRHGGRQPGGRRGRAFESDQNEVLLVLRSGEFISVPRASKREIADRIFDEILKLRLHLYATDGR